MIYKIYENFSHRNFLHIQVTNMSISSTDGEKAKHLTIELQDNKTEQSKNDISL